MRECPRPGLRRVVYRAGSSLAACVVVLIALLLAGCGSGSEQRSERPQRSERSEGSHQPARAAGIGVEPTVVPRVAPRCTKVDWAPSSSRSYAVFVRHRSAAVRMWPSGGARLLGRFPHTDQNGYPSVFAVLDARLRGCRPVWYRVQVPSPPNGSGGWVRASDVRAYPVTSRVVVDLSSRRALVYRRDRLAFSAPVAIGAPQTPTPVGRFFVNERFLLASADGPFGIAALGISAHSEVLQDWVQGGPIALHGTNDPSSIGSAASHGCVRLANSDMSRLFRYAPAGTPVLIRP